MAKPLLRFGIHDFLNASPLLLPLKKNGTTLGLEIITDSPATLADRLQTGDLDLAMIPSVEYFKSAENYRILPNVCIASRGQVGTVLLLVKKPLSKIRSVAADLRSRTSIAALKILFPFSKDLEVYPFPPDIELMLANHPAALIIGDLALALNDLDPNLTVYDLSQEWFQQTGKTFVHAVIALRQGVILSPAQNEFIQKSKLEGRKRIKEISLSYTEKLGLRQDILEDYLENKIRYDLNEEAIDGLIHFSDLCYEHGIIPQKISFQFV